MATYVEDGKLLEIRRLAESFVAACLAGGQSPIDAVKSAAIAAELFVEKFGNRNVPAGYWTMEENLAIAKVQANETARMLSKVTNDMGEMVSVVADKMVDKLDEAEQRKLFPERDDS